MLFSVIYVINQETVYMCLIQECLHTHNFRWRADIPRKVKLEFDFRLVSEKTWNKRIG